MEYKKIGSTNGTHGLNGLIHLNIQPGFSHLIKIDHFIFIEIRNQTYIPYKITQVIQEKKDSFIIELKGFDDIDSVKRLCSKEVWIPLKDISTTQQKLDIDYLKDFSVFDLETQNLIPIEQIIETAGQLIAIGHIQETEIMIPLNDALIKQVDEAKKIIKMNLPAGLLDIYLK